MRALPVILALFACALPLSADGLLPRLSAEQIAEARKLIAGFKANPKGPFYRIRWFCNDGTMHPPSTYPCEPRGGGHQYAEVSPEARRLARWNVDIGTVIVSHSFDDLFDARRDHHRLRELVLENYLVGIDHGWIYRRANAYRGARQVEDEERAGYRFLVRLLSNPQWTRRNYLLANQLIGAMPHGLPDSAVKRVRTLATSIADQDQRFQPIRSKIHSAPGDSDLEAVERFASQQELSPDVRAMLIELANLLREEHASRQLAVRLPAVEKRLKGGPLEDAVDAFASALREGSNQANLFSAGAKLTMEIHEAVTTSNDGRRNIELLDFNALVLEAGFRTRVPMQTATRRQMLAHLRDHFRYAVGGGLLSVRQYEALDNEINALNQAGMLEPEAWYNGIRYLSRAAEWTRATVARDFGPVSALYADFEPAARALVDHLVRGSAALPLANHLEVLLADANQAVGIRHSVLGRAVTAGVVALNPGIAIGRLGIIETNRDAAGAVDPRGIYVIPETVSNLKPMAGILSLDSGNMLSHAQLLAANLGIPNATIPSTLMPTFEKLRDQDLFYAVTPRGVVVIREKASLSTEERTLFIERRPLVKRRIHLDTSRLNLNDKRILTLTELGSRDSGVIAGPKAANLGQLAGFFPNEVAPGLVIPFGIYYDHINRVLPGESTPLAKQISDAYTKADRMRDAGAGPAEISRFIYPKLAHFRESIQGMKLLPGFERQIVERLHQLFGEDGTYGVFVRSDTNAEDLPEFTGAGLNLTVPNQVGVHKILQAVRDVWASPFTERAYDWRSRILIGNDRVFPSVIIQRAVPSDKSGVIATVNLESGDPREWTVNVSEGVSAVVDGGVAESLLLLPGGRVRLLQQARGTYRKVLMPSGGFRNVGVSGDEAILKPDEIARIRKMVAEINARYPAVKTAKGEVLPWDIEFGFENGNLRLFQIRPLVRYQEIQTLELFSRLEGPAVRNGTVKLDERPL